eukprot:jgi/Picsp_1/5023/NSC_02386-R1_---NA---
MGWWSGHVARSPHGAILMAMSHRHDPSKFKKSQIYLPRRSSSRGGMNISSRRSNNARKDRSVSRRLEEPLEAELVVLFGTTSLIILVPWIVKDPRFLVLLPLAVFLVPGLLSTCKEAFIEIIHGVSENRNGERFSRDERASLESKSRNSSTIMHRYPRSQDSLGRWQTTKSLSQKSFRKLTGTRQRSQFLICDMDKDAALKEDFDARESKKGESHVDKRDYVKRIPFFKHWGGFL